MLALRILGASGLLTGPKLQLLGHSRLAHFPRWQDGASTRISQPAFTVLGTSMTVATVANSLKRLDFPRFVIVL